jgi:hypothetical protein
MNNKTIDPKETIDLNSSFTNEEFFKIYKNTFSNPYHIEGELMRLVKSYKAYSILEKKPITHYIKELRNAMQPNPHNDSEFVLFGAALYALRDGSDLERINRLYLTNLDGYDLNEECKRCYSYFIKRYGLLSTSVLKKTELTSQLYAFASLSNRYNKTPYKLMKKIFPYLNRSSNESMLIGALIYVMKHSIEIKIND